MAFLTGGILDFLSQIREKIEGGGTFSRTTDSNEAIRDAIDVIDGYHDVPAKDSSADSQMRDVVGKKDDTSVITVGDVAGLVAYIKGILKTLVSYYVYTGGDTTSTTYTTIASLTGPGELIAMAIEADGQAANQKFVTINIDGAGAGNLNCATALADTDYWVRHSSYVEAASVGVLSISTTYALLHIRFKTSIVIQAREPHSVNHGTAKVIAYYNRGQA